MTPASQPSLPIFTRRRAFLLGAGAVAGAISGASLVPAAASSVPSNLADAFDAAATRHGVPRDLLVAVGHAETRLIQHEGPSQARGYGIMHLVANPGHRTLAEAAELTGHAPDRLRDDAVTNIDGAAAVLRAYADDAGFARDRRADLASWYPVVARYSGAAKGGTAGLYADAVYDALWAGVRRSGVEIEPSLVEPDRRGLQMRTTAAQDVDYPTAQWAAAHSSNYQSASRPGSHPVNYVVIHMAQGTYAGTISWFQNSSANVSAHYVVRSSDGQVTQMVRHADIAWHAGSSMYNQQSVGIEHEGYFDEATWYTESMYRSSAALTRHICQMHAIATTRDSIIGHNEASSTPCPGPIWDWDRYMGYVNEGQGGEPVWDVVTDATSDDFAAGSSWSFSAASGEAYGDEYAVTTPEPVSDPAWFSAELPESGTYQIDVWYPADDAHNDRTPYLVAATGGYETVHVNQRTGGGAWHTLGTFSMAAGRREVVGVSRWTSGGGDVVADAVRLALLG